ncbi:hypothetical protein [Nocardiopsis sp. NRRL B-16309]|uniref:hypothetical protein n=1 Tax=Nocardiopsis sp. NRRL B-16309 TaxID=1519494 RepID=UPI0006AFF835|nr:hypothetical protein [Nocardiopsis sp. NRRL B-16309]KOX23618.1 hypothetical protein ADL05_02580 [Nocardiopsis sp. NRRL B-16309]
MARVLGGTRCRAVPVWIGAVAAGAVVLAATGAAADAQGAPVGLSVSGQDGAAPGEEVVLRTTVANDGDAPVEGALLAQHVPEGMEVLEVGQGGMVEEGIANWGVGVHAGGESVHTVRVRVTEDAAVDERLTSTACLLLDRDAEPAACASDTVRVTERSAALGWPMDRATLVRSVGAGLVLVLLWLLWRRKSSFRTR